jgi:hypothetical protein
MSAYALAFKARNFGVIGLTNREDGFQIADGKPDAAKAAAESTIEIKEAEMQSRGNDDSNPSGL